MKPLAGLLLVIGCLSLAGAAAPGGSASCRCRTIADLRPVWSPADDALVYATTEDAPQIFRFAEGHDTTLRFPVGTHDFTLSPDWSMVAGATHTTCSRSGRTAATACASRRACLHPEPPRHGRRTAQ